MPYWFEPWGSVAQQLGTALPVLSPPVSPLLQRREGRETLPQPLIPVGSARVGYPQSTVQLPVLVMSTELLGPLEEFSTVGVSSCCSSQSQGAVVLPATFGKGCGRVTAVLASNGDQVKVVTLLHEYLSPKQRPWSFLLPRFSVQVTPAQ